MSEEPLEAAVYGSYAPADFPADTPPADPPTAPEETTDEGEAPLPEFDPRVREEFDGLLYLGALTKQFDWLGHRFVIRTLRTGELIQAALVVKGYGNSEGYNKAWQAAILSGCVVSVDGKPLPVVPLTSQLEDTMLAANFRWVVDHWFPPILDYVYEEYIKLEMVVRGVLEAMGKASG